jgi:glycosyltransferase involved in cell wall biosynthesis
MRLILDLRYGPGDMRADPGERVVTLAELAVGLLRKPRRIARLLWQRRWTEILIVRDTLQRSGVQVAAEFVAGLARTEEFRFAPGQAVGRLVSRHRLLSRALCDAAVAVIRELWHSVRLLRAIDREVADEAPMVRPHGGATSVTYLRTEPDIAFAGRYVGGAAAHTTGVVNGLQECGLRVQVFAPQRPDGIDASYFAVAPKRAHHFVSWFTITAYGREVAKAAADHPADFVYQRYALGSYAGIELAQRLEVPLVLEFNGSEVWADLNWGRGELRMSDRLIRLEQANLRAASLVVVVSEVLKDQVLEIGIPEERILVNPNGVDPDRLAPYRKRGPAAWRERLGLEEAPTVGFVGTFGVWHGVTVLPMMVEELARTQPDVRWLLIGGGQLYDDVRGQIEERGLTDRVTVTGIVQRERALELLAASDVCVSPHVPNPDGTRFFGSPTKLFEYMGLAKPIVASDLEQIGEVIDHERTGLLCPPGDAGAAAAAVARLLDDELLRRRLGEAALEEAETTYSWTAHARRILEALER